MLRYSWNTSSQLDQMRCERGPSGYVVFHVLEDYPLIDTKNFLFLSDYNSLKQMKRAILSH